MTHLIYFVCLLTLASLQSITSATNLDVGNEVLYKFENTVAINEKSSSYKAYLSGELLWKRQQNNEYVGHIYNLQYDHMHESIPIKAHTIRNITFKTLENSKTIFVSEDTLPKKLELTLVQTIVHHLNIPCDKIQERSIENEFTIDSVPYKVLSKQDNEILVLKTHESNNRILATKIAVKNNYVQIVISNETINSLDNVEIVSRLKLESWKVIKADDLDVSALTKEIAIDNKNIPVEEVQEEIQKELITKITMACVEIGSVLNNTSVNPKEAKQTLSNYLKLVALTGKLTEDSIKEMKYELNKEDNQNLVYFPGCSSEPFTPFFVFKRALAQTFTETSIKVLQEWLVRGGATYGEMEDLLSLIITTMPDPPNHEYLNRLYGFVVSFRVRMTNSKVMVMFSELLQKLKTQGKAVRCVDDYCYNDAMDVSFLKELSKSLEKAVVGGENKNILLNIHAISSLDNKEVFELFKPYITKEKHVSQFQMLRMLYGLRNYAKRDKDTEFVQFLRALYEDMSVEDERKVLAIYLISLMDHNVVIDMAKDVKDDRYSEQVHSAIKSAIVSISNIPGKTEHKAKMALKSMEDLNVKDYGTQYSKILFKNLFPHKNIGYDIFTMGSKNSYTPKHLQFNILNWNQTERADTLFGIDMSTSSVKNIKYVFNRLFHAVQTKIANQKQKIKSGKDGEFCSAKITELLDIIRPEEEQLEAFFAYKMEHFSGFFSFDNTTLSDNVNMLDQVLAEFKTGMNCKSTKVGFSNEQTTTIRTTSGFLINIAKKTPSTTNIKTHVNIKSTSPLTYGSILLSPNLTIAEVTLNVLYSKLNQNEFFINGPMNEISGVEHNKHVQVSINVKLHLAYDKIRNKYTFKVEVQRPKNDVPVVHFSNKLYFVTHKDMYVSERQEIVRKSPFEFNNINFGRSELGISIDYSGDYFDIRNETKLFESIRLLKQGVFPDLEDFSIREINIGLPSDVPTWKVDFSYQSLSDFHEKCDINGLDEEKIVDCEHITYKATMKWHDMLYEGGVNFLKSNVDKTGVFRFSFNKTDIKNQKQRFGVELFVLSKRPNCNDLNVTYSSEHEPQVNLSMGLQLNLFDSSYGVYPKIFLRRTPSRLNYVKNSDGMRTCQKQMSEGNYQLQPCSQTMDLINLMNSIHFYVRFNPNQLNVAKQNIPLLSNYTEKYKIDENSFDNVEGSEEKQLNLLLEFSDDLNSFDITVRSKGKVKHHLPGIKVDYFSRMIVVNPIHTIETRLSAKFRKELTFQPTCSIDKTKIDTFDYKQYNYKIGSNWYVAMHYVRATPKLEKSENTLEKQLQQLMQLTVLTSKNTNTDNIEVIISYRSPKTNNELVNINLGPKINGVYSIKVNNKKHSEELSEDKTINFYNETVQLFKIPNDELKFLIQEEMFLVYDGERIKIELFDHSLRGELLGLCGNFNGEPSDDFILPSGAVASKEDKFVKEYKLSYERTR